MGSLENQMSRIVDEFCLRPGMTAPKQEDQRLLPLIERPNHLIGKEFPALPLMRIGLSLANSEYRV